jgi:hypothetical protein
MTGTGTIYTNIIDVTIKDNLGIELAWTGTPTGTIQVMVSNSGTAFYALTFNPALAQPTAASGGYVIDINQIPFKYIMLQYTNASGVGSVTAYLTVKDLN